MTTPIDCAIETRKDESKLIKLIISIVVIFAIAWFGLGVLIGSLGQ